MSTTFYNPRAERAVANAMADERRAAADAQRAETALRLVEVQRAQALAADERADRLALRAQADRRAARAERAAVRARLWARVPQWLLSALWAAVIVSPITLAWQAQNEFARNTLHIPAGVSWLFPLAVEAGAWVCAFEAHRRARAGAPAGALPTWMWVLASIAAGINLLHGTKDYGLTAGVALAAMSLLGVLLHHIRQSADQAAAHGHTASELRRALWRRVRFPRLSYAAASIAAARGDVVTVDQAWTAAWVDRYGVGPESSRRDRRLARVIVKHQRRADREAARRGGLIIVGGLIMPAVLDQVLAVSPADEVEQAAQPVPLAAVTTEVDTPIVQAQLSARAAELLPKVRDAIAAGELPAAPSASAIRAMFKPCGSAYAREVRNALASTASEAA